MFVVKDLSLYRGNRLLFESLTLSLPDKKSILITGSNGVGKTTLLKLMAGLLAPHHGSVLFRGEDVWHNSSYQKMTAFLATPPHTHSVYSIETYLQWRALLENKPHPAPWLTEPLAALNLTAAMTTAIKHLSAGMRQKVALLELWDEGKQVLFLDEPFAHLDAASKLVVQAQMLKRKQQGASTVMVSHEALDQSLMDVALTLS